MKIFIILIILTFSINLSFAEEKWHKGIVTKVTENTVTVDKMVYKINPDTVIEDENGNVLPLDALGQKSCCDQIRFLLRDDGYIKKIIVDTSKAVQ